MKKYLLFAFVFTLITMAFSSQAHATDKPMYKAHFMGYTKTLNDFILERGYANNQEEVKSYIMKRVLIGEAQWKKAMNDIAPHINAQWLFFEPNMINYEEVERGQTNGKFYGIFHNPDEPLYKEWNSLKNTYNIQNINPYIITQNARFVERGENIMIRAFDGYDFGHVLKMLMPKEGPHTLNPFVAPYPEKHPDSEKGWIYGTFGTKWAQKIFPTFAHLDSTLVYFENEQGEQDSVYFPLGDAEHNVLDPQKGWKLGNVFDTSGTDLGFHTTPDTATIKAERFRIHDFSPTWNDYGTNTILYTAGDRFGKYEDFREAEYLCAYQTGNPKAGETDLLAYAANISGIQDAFAMDYILVQFVKDITYPSIDRDNLPSDVKSGDEFTIYLKGDYDKMTSWIPEFQVSGIEYEILSQTNHSVTIKALSGGTATITLHHNALLVLDDESVSVNVTGTTDIGEYSADNITISPNPATDYIDISTSAVILNEVKNPVIKIYDVLGVVHLRQSATASSDSGGQVRVDISGLPAGVYFVRIGDKVLKFVKM